jgi:hypothetical protein
VARDRTVGCARTWRPEWRTACFPPFASRVGTVSVSLSQQPRTQDDDAERLQDRT